MIGGVRIGLGYDFHPFIEGRPLLLGGVEIDHDRGLLGHSDADVLSHAVTDALLGAAGLGDIGSYFPDTDPAFKDACSLDFLKTAVDQVREIGFQVGNVDVVVIAETPKIALYKDRIKESIAPILEVGVEDVGIKATTMEGKGPIGRCEGIAVEAVALIFRTAK